MRTRVLLGIDKFVRQLICRRRRRHGRDCRAPVVGRALIVAACLLKAGRKR